MYIVFIFLILVYFNDKTVSRDIEIMNSGLSLIHANDMIVVFFVTIHNHGDKARRVMATMVECCERITDDDVDCGVIQIYGEHIDVLLPGTTQNVTFLYPNIYGYNRRGSCTIDIWNCGMNGADDSNAIRHKIDFDTTIRLSSEVMPPFLQELYSPDKVTRCDTTDLDPFDGCNPVNCRLKYSGLRNFFNHKRKRCQKVPTCIGDPSKELPDIAYVPISNTCRNLEKMVTEEDILGLLSHKYDNADKGDFNSKFVNIQCHHGEIDMRTGLCICDWGWTSELFDSDIYNKGTSLYHMCNVKCHPDAPPKMNYIPFIIGICLALWVTFLVVLCENCNYFVDFYKRTVVEEEGDVCYYHVGSQ